MRKSANTPREPEFARDFYPVTPSEMEHVLEHARRLAYGEDRLRNAERELDQIAHRGGLNVYPRLSTVRDNVADSRQDVAGLYRVVGMLARSIAHEKQRRVDDSEQSRKRRNVRGGPEPGEISDND